VIVGIDLGGTKTRVVAESDGEVVFDESVPTRSWQEGELLDDLANITRLLAIVHGIDGGAQASIAIGAHGLDSDWQVAEFTSRMSANHAGGVLAVNDVELVPPAAGLDAAIAVIVGTGSKVVGHDAHGNTIAAGGHGFLLNDPGSAASLARDAVKAILDGYDLGQQPDELAREFMEHFDVTDVIELSYIFTSDARLATWGPLAPYVFTAADHGSELAARVIDESAALLARDVGRVHARRPGKHRDLRWWSCYQPATPVSGAVPTHRRTRTRTDGAAPHRRARRRGRRPRKKAARTEHHEIRTSQLSTNNPSTNNRSTIQRSTIQISGGSHAIH
jgi:glucosamine kinase